MSSQDTDFTVEELNTLVANIMLGNSVATTLNFSQENLETLYAFAYGQYQAKSYTQAIEVFKLLRLYDVWDKRFSLGQASCEMALGNYEKAIEIYELAAFAGGLDDPTPLYYSAVCHINLKDIKTAIGVLEHALIFGKPEEYKEIRKASADLLEVLKKSQNEDTK